MKFKFLFLAAVIIAVALNVSAEESKPGVFAGVQEYYATEKNLSQVNAEIDTLKDDIEKTEQEISPLKDSINELNTELERKNAEIVDTKNNIERTKSDTITMDGKKSEFDVNKGTGYKIASILPAFIIGLWVSIIVLIFVWKDE